MPSKLDDTSSMHFLFACLEASAPNRIDFQKVAKQFGIQVPAARMRLHRLREALEGKQGSKVTKARPAARKRRKQGDEKKTGRKEGLETNWKGMEDDDDDEEPVVRKFEDQSAKLKKEEDDDNEQAWKLLPEAPMSEASVGHKPQNHALSHYGQAGSMLPLDPALQHNTAQAQAQPQMLPNHVASFGPTNKEIEQPSLTYTYSSAHYAMPHSPYLQAHLPDLRSDSSYHPESWKPLDQQ